MSGLRALALFVAGQLFMGAVAGTLWIALTPRPAEPRPLQVFLHSLATGQEEKTGAEKNPQPALPITVESPSKPRTALAIRPLMDALLGGIHSQQSSPRVADPDPPAPEYPLDGALARTMRERLDTLGAAKDGGLAEAADTLPEVQPLLDQLNALRGKWSLQDVAANPEMLEPLDRKSVV